MQTSKLKELKADTTFWLLLAISLPGIVALWIDTIRAAMAGDIPNPDLQSLAMSSPIAIYLGIARQYPRGKAVEAFGSLAALPATAPDPAAPDHFKVDAHDIAAARAAVDAPAGVIDAEGD